MKAPNMSAQPFQVLYVEDSENDRLLLKKAFKSLTRLNFAHGVPDGAEAVHYLEGSKEYANREQYPFPDLILLDIKMPVMNGFEFLKWMQRQCWGRKPAVVILTSSALSEDINEGSALGADLYQVKPVTLFGLVELMKDVERFMLGRQPQLPALAKAWTP
jgi:CheY-like chemotaxis protein